MLKLACTGDEATVQIKDVTNYLYTMSEPMTGCQAVMAQIAKVTGVEYAKLMDMFLYCMEDERHVQPEEVDSVFFKSSSI